MAETEARPDALAHEDRRALLDVARRSVRYGLDSGAPLPVDPGEFAAPLRAERASFVTLYENGSLRGCIGGLDAARPLVADVALHAFAAAFDDPRFAPVADAEYSFLDYSISVLSPLALMEVASYDELLRGLRPGIDGIYLVAGTRRGTFLPKVWDQLPDPVTFVQHLQAKAGIAPGAWPAGCTAYRYTSEEWDETDA